VKAYLGDLQFSFSNPEFSTTWQCLEVGKMAGYTISPLAFNIDLIQSSAMTGMKVRL